MFAPPVFGDHVFRPPPPPPSSDPGLAPAVLNQVTARLVLEDISGSARSNFTTATFTLAQGQGLQVHLYFDRSGGAVPGALTWSGQALTQRVSRTASAGFAIYTLANAPAGTAGVVVNLAPAAIVHAAVYRLENVQAAAGAVQAVQSAEGTATGTAIPALASVVEGGVLGGAHKLNTGAFTTPGKQTVLNEGNIGAASRKIGSRELGAASVTHSYTFGGSVAYGAGAVSWRPTTAPPFVSGTGTENHGHTESVTGRAIVRAAGTEGHGHTESGTSVLAVNGTGTESHGHTEATSELRRVPGTELHGHAESGTGTVTGSVQGPGTETHAHTEDSGVRVTFQTPTEDHGHAEATAILRRVPGTELHGHAEAGADRAVVRAAGTESHGHTESGVGTTLGQVAGPGTELHGHTEAGTGRAVVRGVGTESHGHGEATAVRRGVQAAELHGHAEVRLDRVVAREAGTELHGHTETGTGLVLGFVFFVPAENAVEAVRRLTQAEAYRS